jgi:hypothetical protein
MRNNINDYIILFTPLYSRGKTGTILNYKSTFGLTEGRRVQL